MGGERRKTAAERFDVAEANGLTTLDQSEIDGNQVFRALEPCTENKYEAIMDFRKYDYPLAALVARDFSGSLSAGHLVEFG
jgi:hypothetical protein